MRLVEFEVEIGVAAAAAAEPSREPLHSVLAPINCRFSFSRGIVATDDDDEAGLRAIDVVVGV